MMEYRACYDDPYRVLAYYIVGFWRPADVVRLLTDSAYIKTQLIKEVRGQDYRGHFLDCTIEDILEKKERMEFMHELDKLAEYLYLKMDRDRLREEIASVLKEAGVECDYSTAGNVSLAST